MVCCKCNKHSKCRKCACVKAGIQCSNCLPSRLGICDNQHRTAVQEDTDPELAPTATALSLDNATTVTMPSAGAAPPPDRQPPSLPELPPERDVAAQQQTADQVDTVPHLAHTITTLSLDDAAGDSTSSMTTEAPATDLPLPVYPSLSPPTFTWGSLSGADFSELLDSTYSEVIHWRRNCFSVPTGKVGRDFVSELARAFGSASALESVAIKATIVLPILLLQKPSKVSKTKDHVRCLERRLQHWVNGDLEELTREGRTIQHRLPKGRTPGADSNPARTFSNLMFKGKCQAALRLLSDSGKGDVLHLNDPVDPNDPLSPSVREALLHKHPQPNKLILNASSTMIPKSRTL